ncbi:branched-chain amino acid transport system II carrier protein [Candidatus Dependentiae bacterium]|nr:branched-chain amino acid transport system II carrier protein [Candidatus Dependentiae bacterium]MBU4387099.1 branched-chain amino acid transport system II carrier protein [Candidatus Dependentiae bacterium]MCG2756519.1 branched-chain amino acid transport system II carrier protein [Candidatus Dependentiae bacterium]
MEKFRNYFKIIISTGLAMFSMFFGAGNVVFPLDLGRFAGNMNFYAILGLLITAVLVPFIGLLAMFLFSGDYSSFFNRIGKIPGLILSAFLLALIGPFMAMPRCVTLSFSTLQSYIPGVSLFYFSLVFCAVLFVFAFKRARILDLLGTILSPLLLISLIILIVKGIFFTHPVARVIDFSKTQIFMYGLTEGYYTMDLLGAFFFSVVILLGLKKSFGSGFSFKDKIGKRKFYLVTIISSIIGAGLLALVYIGFSYVASFYSLELLNIEKDKVLSVLSSVVLGSAGGIVANMAVILACLTTALTLAVVFAEFIQNALFKNKLNYKSSLLITLILTFAMSNLGFMGIIKFSTPILLIIYPVLIVLTLVNLANKLFGFKYVKIPVAISLITSIVWYFVK